MHLVRMAAASLMVSVIAAGAQSSGQYTLRYDKPQQVIKGLGFEIQNDSIGSGNSGMPWTRPSSNTTSAFWSGNKGLDISGLHLQTVVQLLIPSASTAFALKP